MDKQDRDLLRIVAVFAAAYMLLYFYEPISAHCERVIASIIAAKNESEEDREVKLYLKIRRQVYNDLNASFRREYEDAQFARAAHAGQ
jgi:hypothetical protein